MSQPTTGEQSSVAVVQRSTAHASLAALGVHLHHPDLFGPIRQQVHIAQKTVRYTPVDKLYDAFIALLAGVQGLVEINGRVRPDPALQAAFGRHTCAEQSVEQDILDACTEANRQRARSGLEYHLPAAQPGLSPCLRAGLAGTGYRYEWAALRPEGCAGHARLLCQAAQPPGAATRARAGDPLP
jgi:hypothetical protein